MRSSFKYLGLLILIYIVDHFLILLSNDHTISYELHRGNVAKEFLEGLRLPWWNYLTDAYSLAPVFNGFLTAPSFFIFGKTLFALKFVPFCWHLFSLTAWFFVWRLISPPREVFFILLLFVLAPPRIVEFGLANHGTHFEMILWTALSILILDLLITKKRWIVGGGILLGLIGGFSASLQPVNLLTAFLVLLFYTLSKSERNFYFPYGAGFLAGFAPALFYNFQNEWAGFDIFRKIFSNISTPHDLLLHARLIFLKEEGGVRGLAGFGYSIIYLTSLIFLTFRKWGFWRNIRGSFDVEGFALFYQMFFLAVTVVIKGVWAPYYLFPLVPFMGMTVVTMGKVSKSVWLLLLGFCLSTGIIGNIQLIDWKGMGKTLSTKGYSYAEFSDQLAHNVGYHFDLFAPKSKILLKGRSFEDKKAFYKGLPNDVFVIYQPGDEYKILNYIDRVEKRLQPILHEKFKEAQEAP